MEFRRWLSFAISYRIYLFPAFRSSQWYWRKNKNIYRLVVVNSVEVTRLHSKMHIPVCDKKNLLHRNRIRKFREKEISSSNSNSIHIELTFLIKKPNGFRQIAKSFYRPWEYKNLHPIHCECTVQLRVAEGRWSGPLKSKLFCQQSRILLNANEKKI